MRWEGEEGDQGRGGCRVGVAEWAEERPRRTGLRTPESDWGISPTALRFHLLQHTVIQIISKMKCLTLVRRDERIFFRFRFLLLLFFCLQFLRQLEQTVLQTQVVVGTLHIVTTRSM